MPYQAEIDRIIEKQGKLVEKFWNAIKQYPEVEKSKWFKEKVDSLLNSGDFGINTIFDTVDTAKKQYKKQQEFVEGCIALFPSVDEYIKENKTELKRFFDNPAIFFVVDDLLEIKNAGINHEYCCGIDFRLEDEEILIEASYFSSKEKCLKEKVFNYIDYTIRPMRKHEFNNIYIPERLNACDFSDECDAIQYLKDMQELWKREMQ